MTHRDDPKLFAILAVTLLGVTTLSAGLGAGTAVGHGVDGSGATLADAERAGNDAPPGDVTTPVDGAGPTNGTEPTNGTDPGDETAPTNGTSPANGTAPTNGTEPTNGTTPTNGTAPTNGTEPTNGTDPGDETAPTNGTSPANGTEPTNGTSPADGTNPVLAVTAVCDPSPVPADSRVTCRANVTGGTVRSYDWRLGGDRTATGPMVTRRFESPGDHTVTVVATGPEGTTARATATVEVGPPETPPTAAVTCENATVRVGEVVSCSAAGSTDERGVTAHEWRLGDDATAAGPTVDHRYTEPGEYTVTVAVTDTNGTTDSARTTVTVEPDRPPVARLDCPATTLRPGHEFACDAADSTDDGGIVAHEWTLDDGVTATGPRVVHAYGSPGRRTVTLTVTDERGATDTARATVAVAPNDPPTVRVDCAPATVPAGATVRCRAPEATDPDGSVAGLRWSLGDGRVATGPNVSHEYARAGEYTVRAVAVDDDGAEAAATTTVAVEPNRPPDATVLVTPRPAVVGRPVTLRAANLTDPDGRVRRVNWSVDGDRAFGPRVTRRFETPGDHEVALRLTDDDGRRRTVRRTVTVLDRPSVSIEHRPERPRVDRTVVLTAAGAPNGSRVRWDTDGDDDADARGRTAATRFDEAGRRSVSVTVTTPSGVTVRRSAVLTVREGAGFRLRPERRTATVGEPVGLALRVSNRVDDRPIEAKLELDLPPGLSVAEVGGPGLDGPASTGFVTVPAGRTTTLRLSVRADEPGDYRLGGTVVYRYAGQTLREERTLERQRVEIRPRPTATPNPEETAPAADAAGESTADSPEAGSSDVASPTPDGTAAGDAGAGSGASDDAGGGDGGRVGVLGASLLTLLTGFLLRAVR